MKFSQCKYLIECDLHAINNGGGNIEESSI